MWTTSWLYFDDVARALQQDWLSRSEWNGRCFTSAVWMHVNCFPHSFLWMSLLAIKANHSCRTTCECGEPAREQRIALYERNQQDAVRSRKSKRSRWGFDRQVNSLHSPRPRPPRKLVIGFQHPVSLVGPIRAKAQFYQHQALHCQIFWKYLKVLQSSNVSSKVQDTRQLY